MVGNLYIVATPIGNLTDITQRAIDILQSVDFIAAEDTRHSQTLLQHYRIATKLVAYHEHNESTQADTMVAELQAGKSIALISDAGTPLISDPGYSLVRKAIAGNIPVIPLPGPCAITTALSASGLATDSFYFAGFLPTKTTARQTRLSELENLSTTLIFYEAPHRILDSLHDVQTIFGERQVVLARELTKKFETFYRGSAADIIAQLTAHEDEQRGEMVILVSGARINDGELSADALNVLKILLSELPLKQAASLAAQITREKKNALYDWAIAHKSC